MLNLREYHISNPFLFQKPNPIPQYRHEAMRAFYVFHELPDVLRLRTESPTYLMATKADVYYASFLWPFLLLVGSGLYSMWRSELRIVLFCVALLGADLFLQIWPAHAHYAAPATGAFVLMALFGLRSFRNTQAWMGICVSRAVACLMLLCLFSPLVECLRDPYSIHPVFINTEWQQPHASFETAMDLPIPLQVQRDTLRAQLEKIPGKHLVIVHHPYHDVPSVDWIYNNADLANSKVIWARDMGYQKNRELINAYADRQVWFVDRAQAKLIPYGQAMLPWKLALDSPPFGPASDQGILAKTGKATAVPPMPQIAAHSTKEPALR
jgi:hypothetical protein